MTDPFKALLIVFAILEVKHFIFDFPAQTSYQLKNKGFYGHPGGLLHAGLHVLGTATTFLVVTPTVAFAAALLAGEFLAHYHIDWVKAQIVRRSDWTPGDDVFWWALGADQFAHQLTYVAIGGLLVGFGIGS